MKDYKEVIKDLKSGIEECDRLTSMKVALNMAGSPDKKYVELAEDFSTEVITIMQTMAYAANVIDFLSKRVKNLEEANRIAHEERSAAEAGKAKAELELKCLIEKIDDVIRGED